MQLSGFGNYIRLNPAGLVSDRDRDVRLRFVPQAEMGQALCEI
jgi:hypothetical protein